MQGQTRSSERVQMYSERLLRIAEDAYPPLCQKDQSGRELVQRQLLDEFLNGCFTIISEWKSGERIQKLLKKRLK